MKLGNLYGYELLLADSLCVETIEFITLHHDFVRRHQGRPDEAKSTKFSTEVISLRTDGTNGRPSIRYGKKGFMCEIRVRYRHHDVDLSDCEGPPQRMDHRFYADLEQCPDECDGLAVRAMMMRQFINHGGFTWVFQDESIPDALRDHIRVFFFGSDRGSDEVRADKLIRWDVKYDWFTWILRQYCLRHQLHLLTKAQFKRMPKYYGSLAKVVNTWRSGTNAKKLYDIYCRLYPDRAHHAKKLPPVALKGRWTSAHNTECWIMRCGIDLFDVYAEAFGNPFDESDVNDDEMPGLEGEAARGRGRGKGKGRGRAKKNHVSVGRRKRSRPKERTLRRHPPGTSSMKAWSSTAFA
jgi:hypothetical protein